MNPTTQTTQTTQNPISMSPTHTDDPTAPAPDGTIGGHLDPAAVATVRAAVVEIAHAATSTSGTLEDPVVGYNWQRVTIAAACDVRVLATDITPMTLTFGQQTVRAVEMTLTVATTRHAHRLAVLLDLPHQSTDLAVAWQAWTGWFSEASTRQPVLVTVTAPNTSTWSPQAPGPGPRGSR